jgi:hypothetical protein
VTHAHTTTVDLATLPADELRFLQDYRALNIKKRARLFSELIFWLIAQYCKNCPCARTPGNIQRAVGAEGIDLIVR